MEYEYDYFKQYKSEMERIRVKTAHDEHKIEFREMCAKMINDVVGDIATVRMSTYLYTSKEEIDIFVENLINGGDILDAYFLN